MATHLSCRLVWHDRGWDGYVCDLGMLTVPSYREQWDRKREWYVANEYWDRAITSDDGLDGGIDATAIERTAREWILLEG